MRPVAIAGNRRHHQLTEWFQRAAIKGLAARMALGTLVRHVEGAKSLSKLGADTRSGRDERRSTAMQKQPGQPERSKRESHLKKPGSGGRQRKPRPVITRPARFPQANNAPNWIFNHTCCTEGLTGDGFSPHSDHALQRGYQQMGEFELKTTRFLGAALFTRGVQRFGGLCGRHLHRGGRPDDGTTRATIGDQFNRARKPPPTRRRSRRHVRATPDQAEYRGRSMRSQAGGFGSQRKSRGWQRKCIIDHACSGSSISASAVYAGGGAMMSPASSIRS